MRPRKAEREALTGLLDQEWDSTDDLVLAVFDQVAGDVVARDWWMVMMTAGTALWVYGPYGTRRRAEIAIGELQFTNPESTVYIRKMCNFADMEESNVEGL